MYQRLGNLYTTQRIGSFESDGTGFGGGRGRACGRGRGLTKLSNEQLADRLTRKEAKIVELQQRIAAGKAGKNAARRLERMQAHAARMRETLAARPNPVAINGLGTFESICNPVGFVAAGVIAVLAYKFVIQPKLARRKRRR